jgi:hypothetical protein
MSIAQNPATQRGKIEFSTEAHMNRSPAAAHGDGTSEATPVATERTFDDAPNRVADAAALLAKFCARDGLLVARGSGPQLTDDDRAAVIAIQLLACASQLERIADSLTALIAMVTGPGKTQTAYELVAKYPEIFGAGQDDFAGIENDGGKVQP